MRMAVAMFLCCERSSWQATTMPVGRWVRRTAESVLLTCWPPAPDGAEGVDAQVAVGDLDVEVVLVADVGEDHHAGEAGLAARVGVERADADEAVHADLGAQVAVGVLALDRHLGAADAGLLGLLDVEQSRP
jgi:hypothetical protein